MLRGYVLRFHEMSRVAMGDVLLRVYPAVWVWWWCGKLLPSESHVRARRLRVILFC